MHQKLSKSVDM